MEIREILKDLGHTDLLSPAWYAHIIKWHSWYRGNADFHHYWVYNGKKKVPCIRKTLQMAKKISEDKADLLLNEKVKITIAGPKDGVNKPQGFLDGVLDRNNFWVKGNQLIELVNGLGTGAIVEYMDGGETRLKYIPAPNIWPLSWSSGEITECAFASYVSIKSKEYIYIERHLLDAGKYVVHNHLYDKEGGKAKLPEGVAEKWNTGSETPLYQIIMPNIVNNIDIANPMGISAFANSIDELKAVDLAFDSLCNEFEAGRKRIFVNGSLLKVDTSTGDPVPIFDMNDTTFYELPGEEGKDLITESNMTLRVTEHIDGIQEALDILSEKVGFGKGYYKFDGKTGEVKTAREIISQDSKLFRRIRKDEIILRKALTDMAAAILFLGGFGTNHEISISFDDSIFEDTDTIKQQAMLERNAGLIDDIEYFMMTRGLEEEAAAEFVAKMHERSPAPDNPEDYGFGSGEGA